MENTKQIDELDFFSPSFDPLKALQSREVQPPIANARPQDNIHQCRRLLPPEHPMFLSFQEQGAKRRQGSRDVAKQRASYVKELRERQELKVNPIDEIGNCYQRGPLSLLRGCMSRKQRITVVTRHHRGVRGRATGTLIAFDGHFNLILKDVVEDYTVLLTLPSETKRTKRKQEHRRRTMKQVFIAGNSVVSVVLTASREEKNDLG